MISRVRKKLVFRLVLCTSFIFNAVTAAENSTVVMKLRENETMALEPRLLINQYNNERKVNNIKSETIQAEEVTPTEEGINVNETKGYEANLNFPHNLDIVIKVLKNLKNEKCVRDTTTVLEAMTRHEKWTLQMFDSFPKFPVGILYGNFYQLGNFDECVGVQHDVEISKNATTKLQGQYCLADIHFQFTKYYTDRYARSTNTMTSKKYRNKFNNTVLHWGICLPNSCTPKDAEIFVKEIFTSVVDNFEIINVKVDENKCYYEKSLPISTLEIIFGCTIGVFFIFTMLATGFHCWYLRQRKRCVVYNVDSVRSKQSSSFTEILLCFSVIQTASKLLHATPNELNLECICGIKFISMCLIVAGHTILFIFGGPLENVSFFDEESVRVQNGFFINNPLLVDTFLFVSAFLMARLLLIELEKRKGKINFLILYIARYIRLTPAYAVVIGLYTTWLYRMGSGPFWQSKIGLERDRCLRSWWTNVLYLNNYVNTDQLCMFQSWYLAVDYHLFIIAPFVIYVIWKFKNVGKSLLSICTVISIAVPFWITYKNHLDPTFMVFPPEVEDISTNFYFSNVYIKTHMRASSYCIGLFFGYLVHKLQSSGTKIPSYIIWLGWILASLFGTVAMFSIVIFYNPEHMIGNLESSIYAAFHRIAWCLSVGWVITVCITDNAAVVNTFLSWKPFISLSRLTYCAYLANGFVEIYNMGVLRQPTYLSRYEMACTVLGHLILTFTLALILCVFFESPIHGLERILLKKDKHKEQTRNCSIHPVEES